MHGAVVAAALIGVFASPLVTLLTNHLAAKHERESIARDACYLAVRVAVILEQFAIQCAENIGDQELHRNSGGHAGTLHGKFPQLPPYPDEADWRELDPGLLTRALSLRNEFLLSDRAIAILWDIQEPDSVPQEYNQQCGKCGYMAWQLAADMRRQYGLPAFDTALTSWNVVGALKPLHDEVLGRARENVKLGRIKKAA